ncbi:hypothetical protein LCI18_007093 [Fusarium solani-melongenae]|uniref:Uncharacterized protein n=1 Tax=Fusarium solani subsp. cucurbitae TaxID=2747967 RepID=A0ACD3Z4H3_FUSSC|nr:hypothetical protein LCI18_007093 [Fusarium solani-melongenae]
MQVYNGQIPLSIICSVASLHPGICISQDTESGPTWILFEPTKSRTVRLTKKTSKHRLAKQPLLELKSRHIQFIALGGTIGTGLFLGIGSALTRAGPLSIFLGYSITGVAIWMLMQVLAEMAVWISLPGAIPQFCARFVDPALGFAVGWNNWYFCAIAVPVEISAAANLVGYWTESVNVAVWISIFIILIVFLNFIFASIKIITMVGLLILAFILDLGGDTGRFLGFFSVLVNAAFSYAGVEIVAVASGESQNPKRNLPKAARRIFWRILFFYSLGSLAIVVLVPYNDPDLLSQQAAGVHTAAASPWVIAIKRAGIRILPSIINAVILSSALSSGNAFLYTRSRYLLALASKGHAPKFLLKTTGSGNPIYCVAATAVFSPLTYLSVWSGPNQIFLWFQSLTTMCTLITWSSICVAYLHFYDGLKANNISRKTLVHRAPFQPYGAIIALVFFLIIIIFNGFAVFFPGNWNVYNFVTAYIGIPIFVAAVPFHTRWWHLPEESPPKQSRLDATKAAGTSNTDLRCPF